MLRLGFWGLGVAIRASGFCRLVTVFPCLSGARTASTHMCVCVLYACLSLCECAFVPLAGCVSLRVHAVYVVARGFATEGSSVFVI